MPIKTDPTNYESILKDKDFDLTKKENIKALMEGIMEMAQANVVLAEKVQKDSKRINELELSVLILTKAITKMQQAKR
ncbi:hypothetical protein [Helicobacter pylori]|uniref:hypothetical protein n=1 Tax=Helicobacter pylori TaxID=210 RepID=UPI000AF73D94|nr:hypothetical protein [Helicobacter pylori]